MEHYSKMFLIASALYLVSTASASNYGREKRQTSNEIDVVVVGGFKRTQHAVAGEVYAFNRTLLIIDGFTFDGLGSGVFINVATEGKNRREYIANRRIVDYPSALDSRPIERPYLGERLFINLPADADVCEVKWLSVWCEVFGISFGELKFPKYVKSTFCPEGGN